MSRFDPHHVELLALLAVLAIGMGGGALLLAVSQARRLTDLERDVEALARRARR